MAAGDPMPNPSAKVYIAAAVIGAIAVVLAAWIGRSSGVSVGREQALATAEIQQIPALTQVNVTQVAITQIAVTQIAVTQIIATSPPAPTAEPIVIVATPTSMPLPSATPEPDNTPAGSILGEGDTWKQDGAELTLVQVDFGAKQTNIAWRFKNNSSGPLLVQYSGDNFIVKDNLGHVLTNKGFQNFNNWHINEVFPSGKSVNNAGMSPLLIEADLSNTQITEIIITVKDVSRIKLAQWKIPINIR